MDTVEMRRISFCAEKQTPVVKRETCLTHPRGWMSHIWNYGTILITYSVENLVVPQLAKKFPVISWNPKVQHRVNKISPLVSILSHINPVHNHIPFFEDQLLSLYLSLRFASCPFHSDSPPKLDMQLSPLHTCQMPCPSRSSWFDRSTGWGVKIMNFLSEINKLI